MDTISSLLMQQTYAQIAELSQIRFDLNNRMTIRMQQFLHSFLDNSGISETRKRKKITVFKFQTPIESEFMNDSSVVTEIYYDDKKMLYAKIVSDYDTGTEETDIRIENLDTSITLDICQYIYNHLL